MTCYKTLTIREAPPRAPPASVVDAPMAHHLVKWWRNKFRNGYKKFHLGTEGERTDTEELVGRAASQCSAPPDLLPSEARALLQPTSPDPRPRSRWRSRSPSPPPPASPAPPSAFAPRLPSPLVPHLAAPHTPHAADTHTHTPQPHNLQQEKPPRLRFEELTCDVQVHEATSRQQPLQFSFTLYDLDGHGRMTKDDIAGIVSTIYESVGKSVTVPHYGSKTIQVRLTVVPESPATAAERGVGGARPKGRRRARRRKDTFVTGAKRDCGDATDDERRSRLSVDDDSSCSGERRPVRARAPPPRASTSPPHRHNAHKEARERRPSKKRSGSLQRRELLQIIQANMEKNHLSFQTSRKPYERVIHEEESPNPKQHRQRSRAFTVSAKPAADAPHKVRSEHPGNNGYLDLAHTDRLPACQPAGADSNLCRYDRYLHAVICSSATHANSGFHQKNLPSTPPVPAPQGTPPKPHKIPKTHHKSRSHDASQTPRAPPPEPRVLQIIFL